jgi:uncharacterized protein (TIGR03000 family)
VYSYPYGVGVYPPAYAAPAPSTAEYYSAYGPAPAAAGSVIIDVQVPAPDAEVWIDEAKTIQTGIVRRFVSPPLGAGSFDYRIRARWKEDGRTLDQTRDVQVQAGQQVSVDFTQALRETVPPPSPK